MEEKKKKRGWIKDAAIIFLVILLVLTFFSNTIMNRSLPEVTTQYVTSGTITTKIRGSGTVVARENYDVTIDQTRKVQSVAVRSGDEVHAGDVLFTLERGDSSELEAAKETLASLEKQYQISLINASTADYARENRQIEKSRKELTEAQTALQELEASAEEGGEYALKLAEAQAAVAEKEAALQEAQAELNTEAASDDAIAALKQAVKDAQALVRQKEAEVKAAKEAMKPASALVKEKNAVYTEKNEILQNCKELRDQYMGGSSDYSAVSDAQDAVLEAQQALTDCKTAYETAKVLYGSDYAALVSYADTMMETQWNSIRDELTASAETAYRNEQGLSASDVLTPEQEAQLQSCVDTALADVPALRTYQDANRNIYLPAAAELNSGSALAEAYSAYKTAEADIASAQSRLSSAENRYADAYSTYWENNQQNTAYVNAQKKVDAAQKEVDAAAAELKTAQKALDDLTAAEETAEDVLAEANEALNEANTALNEADTRLNTAANELEAAREAEKSLRSSREDALETAQARVESCAESLEDLVFSLEQQKLADNKSQQLEAMDRKEQLDAIDRQKALIEELSQADGGTEVLAKVSGIVKSISVSAGYKAEAAAVLATIEVPDLGYTLSFSVTNEQARRLHVGDTSTVSNFYWGSQINAELISIVTDPQNPQSSKRLTFSLTGDVTAGSTLTLSVGDKNATYDMVVPNSALRSDSKGSFILIITAKNSPLGNRYYASRVDVEVVSADDQYSAISGALEGYESVIINTSGNAPIASGDQVRLADNNA